MSKRQTRTGERILYAVIAYQDEHHRTPSYRQIAEIVGLASTGAVSYQIVKLEKEGYITRVFNEARSLVVVKRPLPENEA